MHTAVPIGLMPTEADRFATGIHRACPDPPAQHGACRSGGTSLFSGWQQAG